MVIINHLRREPDGYYIDQLCGFICILLDKTVLSFGISNIRAKKLSSSFFGFYCFHQGRTEKLKRGGAKDGG